MRSIRGVHGFSRGIRLSRGIGVAAGMVAVVVLAGGGPVSAAGEDASPVLDSGAAGMDDAGAHGVTGGGSQAGGLPANVTAQVRFAEGDVDAALRDSAVVVRRRYVMPAPNGHPLALVAEFVVMAVVLALKPYGLTGYVPAGYVRTGAVTGPDTTVAPSPRRRGAGGGGVHPAACWYHEFQYGSALWGKGSEYWCGDGNWITYRSSDCWGGSDWSNYRYGGCSRWDDYGAGWNVSDLTVQWAFCYSWFGYCANGWSYPWEKYRYSAWGAVYWLGGW